jgi:hypothetical protein
MTCSQKQGCQMEYFHTKNNNFGIFMKALEWKLLGYFMVIGYISPRFGMLQQE